MMASNKISSISEDKYQKYYQLQQQGQFEEAEAGYRELMKSPPVDVNVYTKLADICLESKRIDEAIGLLERALETRPGHKGASFRLGNIYSDRQAFEQAIQYYHMAIARKDNFVEAHYNLANVYMALNDYGKAIEHYQRAVHYKNDFSFAYNNMGSAYFNAGDLKKAASQFEKAIEIDADYIDAYFNLGHVLNRVGEYKKARQNYLKVIELSPRHRRGYYNLGVTYVKTNHFKNAVEAFKKEYELFPEDGDALTHYWYYKNFCCDWQDFDKIEPALHQQLALQQSNADMPMMGPFPLLAMSDDPQLQLDVAKFHAQKKVDAIDKKAIYQDYQLSDDKIKVAYLSADFHDHATACLMAEMFELHDRRRFEIIAISFGMEYPEAALYLRLKKTFDHFINVRHLQDDAVAKLIHDMGVHIAVDLKGYTYDSRSRILVYRPAPIQVNYLGYPSTMAGDFIDYLIADKYIIPKNLQKHYSEKIVYLNDSYQVNDMHRPHPAKSVGRENLGLGKSGFVFCCFNHSYKVTPTLFATWMRILHKVVDSKLWLFESDKSVKDNLKKEAKKHGIDSDRLVFARMVPLEEHLERIQYADLFIDTFPCNAHTTASDALWMGVPVLTLSGQSFASRVAGSLLKAVGLVELITDNLEDYEEKAIALALDKSRLEKYKEHLNSHRSTFPLFDAKKQTSEIEKAYEKMLAIYQQGQQPYSFSVDENTTESKPFNIALEDEEPRRIPYSQCPLCQCERIAPLNDNLSAKEPYFADIIWFACTECHHTFTSGYLNPKAKSLLFPNDSTHFEWTGALDGARFRYATLIERLRPYKTNGRWLHYASSHSEILLVAKEYGFEPYALNVNQACANALAGLDISASLSSFNPSDPKVDVISLINSLVREPFPLKTLRQCYQSLNKDGILIISVPNNQSALWHRLNREKINTYWTNMQHLHHFSVPQLEAILSDLGFRIVKKSVSLSCAVGMDIIAVKS